MTSRSDPSGRDPGRSHEGKSIAVTRKRDPGIDPNQTLNVLSLYLEFFSTRLMLITVRSVSLPALTSNCGMLASGIMTPLVRQVIGATTSEHTCKPMPSDLYFVTLQYFCLTKF